MKTTYDYLTAEYPNPNGSLKYNDFPHELDGGYKLAWTDWTDDKVFCVYKRVRKMMA